MPFIPINPTLDQISSNDTMNLKGQIYAISSVTSMVNNGIGKITATVVLADANTTTVVCHDYDTVAESAHIDAGGTQHILWSQSVKA